MRTAAAALNMAALRVNIGSFLHLKFSTDANLGAPQQRCLRCSKQSMNCAKPTQSYVGGLMKIGDAALTVSIAKVAMPNAVGRRRARREDE
jgi:hypothetical protein